MSGKKEQPTHVDQRWLLDHLRCLWPRRSLLKRGTRNSASPTPPCDQPDARVIETTGGPRQTLSLQTIGPHVGLRGATGVAALAAAALQSSVPMRTVTLQQLVPQPACRARARECRAAQGDLVHRRRRPAETLAAAAQPLSLESAKASTQPSIAVSLLPSLHHQLDAPKRRVAWTPTGPRAMISILQCYTHSMRGMFHRRGSSLGRARQAPCCAWLVLRENAN